MKMDDTVRTVLEGSLRDAQAMATHLERQVVASEEALVAGRGDLAEWRKKIKALEEALTA